MIKIGIECESIEDAETWGVARELSKLLENIASRPELTNEFRFFLYFKKKIPDYDYLKNPIFTKKIISFSFLPDSFSLYYYILLPIKLWFEKLDVIYFPNYMLPLIFCGKSIVSLTDDVYYESANHDLPIRYRLAYKIFSGWAAKRATQIVAMSETSKRELVRLYGINPGRIAVNWHGVEMRPSALGSRLPAVPYLLYIGQAFPRRHLKESLLAFEKIAPRFSDLRFMAIGKDKYQPPIIDKLCADINKRLGRDAVVRKEYVSDNELSDLYAGAKAVVYISSREAFGLPPLEGLAHGTVPIVADTEINREIYEDNAFFVKNYDSIEAIAIVFETVMLAPDQCQTIIDASKNITKRFNWRDHTDRFLNLARKIATHEAN